MSQAGEGKVERVFEVQNDIGAKPCRKNKILHSDQFSPGPGSAVGGKLKSEKKKLASQASSAVSIDWGLGKRVHVIFLCCSTPYFPIFPHSGAWSGHDQLIHNSCEAGS